MSIIGDYLEKTFSLKGKIIVLTGAAGGLGSAICEALAGAGATVIITDYDLEAAETLAKNIIETGGDAIAMKNDVSEIKAIPELVDKIIKKHSKIDVLINLAGVNKREGVLDVKPETYERIMNINLRGTFYMCQTVGKQMYKQKSGNVINIGSHNDEDMLGGCSVYGATKSGVVALTRALAVEWAQYNIRANCVSPGHFLTPLSQVNWEHETRTPWLRERIAMRRPGLPEELVGIVLYLASDASSYTSGQAFHIDGGCLCGGSPWEFDTEYK